MHGKPSTSTVTAAVCIAEAVFSRDGTPPSTDRLEWVAREFEDFLGHCGGRSRLVLTVLVRLVAFLAPLFIGRLVRFSTLSLADRVCALTRLEERFGDPLLAVKAMLCLLYYEHPGSALDVGFDGVCAVPRGPKRLSVLS
jgi:hypothetical protein